MKQRFILSLIIAAFVTACGVSAAQTEVPDILLFFEAARSDPAVAEAALDEIAASWRDGYTPFIINMSRMIAPSSPIRQRLIGFLETQTGQQFGQDLVRWGSWMWDLPADLHPDYGIFKGLIYGQIDPRMREFFPLGVRSDIRLDEVEWGGVVVNGIPPLDHPVHVSAVEADYLEDSNIVFGISINGEARAYPKRIFAWHEMALDEIGGVDLTIIYCTLCGTVLPYESEVGGELRKFGTSGLLYRSNKLFFDETTMSLWSTLEGRPVIGQLAGSGLSLSLRSSVTTTWGDWRRRHPDTRVLSIDTGYERDYGEGVAYRDYFATDALMFQVPRLDDRLNNKDEVLVLRVDSETGDRIPVAIAEQFLRANQIYPFNVAGRPFVVITTPGGENRVYRSEGVGFDPQSESIDIVDETGRNWRLEEDALVAEDSSGLELARFPANRAFWFGWYAQFPETELIH